jgi:hypothetical protein
MTTTEIVCASIVGLIFVVFWRPINAILDKLILPLFVVIGLICCPWLMLIILVLAIAIRL